MPSPSFLLQGNASPGALMTKWPLPEEEREDTKVSGTSHVSYDGLQDNFSVERLPGRERRLLGVARFSIPSVAQLKKCFSISTDLRFKYF